MSTHVDIPKGEVDGVILVAGSVALVRGLIGAGVQLLTYESTA